MVSDVFTQFMNNVKNGNIVYLCPRVLFILMYGVAFTRVFLLRIKCSFHSIAMKQKRPFTIVCHVNVSCCFICLMKQSAQLQMSCDYFLLFFFFKNAENIANYNNVTKNHVENRILCHGHVASHISFRYSY